MKEQERLFLTIVRSMKAIGYGRMMQIISHEWYRHDPNGALSIGECYGLLSGKERKVYQSLADHDSLFKDSDDGN